MARSHPHHAHRRQKQARNAARLGVAGGVTGVVGVAAVAGLIMVARSHGDRGEPPPRSVAAEKRASHPRTTPLQRGTLAGVHNPSQLKTGTKLDVGTPEGFSYSLAAVKAGTSERPLASTRTTPPHGTTLGYIDYMITNTGTEPALLDFPADLFVRRSQVPAAGLSRCMPQPGAPADMCTLPDHTDVVNTLGFAPPRSQDEDQYIPAGASYLVRVATDTPVRSGTTAHDLGLYVWNPRFVPDRRALRVPLP